jgi:hypothetical protein
VPWAIQKQADKLQTMYTAPERTVIVQGKDKSKDIFSEQWIGVPLPSGVMETALP